VARGVLAVAAELLRLVREMIVIPVQLWLTIAELAGAVVLAAWRLVWPVGLAAYRIAGRALAWGEANVRPVHGALAVSLAAVAAIVAAQFLDYRAISVGAPEYSGVEAVAPAPPIGEERTGSAHAWVGIPLAVAALAVIAGAMRGRWRAARLLILLGLAVVAISLAIDAPKGLDEGAARVTYEGARAELREGFWAQLVAGSVLILCGPLLSASLRPSRRPAPAPGSDRPGRPSALGSSRLPGAPMGAEEGT
jgi:hypothetical protein